MAAIDIEKLLTWAYRDELPKRYTSSAEGNWRNIRDYGSLGGVSISDHTPQRYDYGLPHPDAEKIELAVGQLSKVVIDWEKSATALMGELAGWMGSRDVLLLGSINVAALVTMHANMGTRPDWHAEQPIVTFVPSPKDHRRPSLIGECRGKNLYTIGARCPLRMVPSPHTIALARADYAAWHHGLAVLADQLQLDAHIVAQPTAPSQPWFGAEPARVIHLVGEWPKGRPLPLKSTRPLAGPPFRRGRADKTGRKEQDSPDLAQDTSPRSTNL